MDIVDAKKFFISHAKSLRRMCDWEKYPWVFLCEAAFIEYLSKMVYSPGKDADLYKNFIEEYMGEARRKYKTFKYRNGNVDLPLQAYHVLRCGIVHSFSFIPDKRAKVKGGRDRSVVIAHSQPGLKHLSHYKSKNVADAACFVAEDFADDLLKVVKLIFKKAKKDPTLKANIEARLRDSPPIIGKI